MTEYEHFYVANISTDHKLQICNEISPARVSVTSIDKNHNFHTEFSLQTYEPVMLTALYAPVLIKSTNPVKGIYKGGDFLTSIIDITHVVKEGNGCLDYTFDGYTKVKALGIFNSKKPYFKISKDKLEIWDIRVDFKKDIKADKKLSNYLKTCKGIEEIIIFRYYCVIKIGKLFTIEEVKSNLKKILND